MNLLYLSFPYGGLDTNVRVLAPELLAAGHNVCVLYLLNPGAREQIPGIEGCRVHVAYNGGLHYYAARVVPGLWGMANVLRSLEDTWALKRMVSLILERENPDLIEIPEIFSTPQLLGGLPFIVRLHASAWAYNDLADDKRSLSDRLHSILERRTLLGAAGISTPSSVYAEYISRTCAVPRSRIELIPYPVDTEEFSPGKGRHGSQVLFVGRVERRKGADALLDAMPLVWASRPDCEFIFAGQVSPELRPRIESLGSRIRLLGFCLREKVLSCYQGTTLCAFPSLWDNSPNVIYEAMSCATPVVAARVGGIPELVEHGVTGMLVPPNDPKSLADAILHLLKDRQLRKSMGCRAREKVLASYSARKVAAMTTSFYARLLS